MRFAFCGCQMSTIQMDNRSFYRGLLAHSAFQGPLSLADALLVLGPRLLAWCTLRWRLSLYCYIHPRLLLNAP